MEIQMLPFLPGFFAAKLPNVLVFGKYLGFKILRKKRQFLCPTDIIEYGPKADFLKGILAKSLEFRNLL